MVAAGGSITINGNVTCDGVRGVIGHGASGGSGGAIFLQASNFEGNGKITALGGNGITNTFVGGGGGGGRIAVHYGEKNFNGTISAAGGQAAEGAEGGPGTVFLLDVVTEHTTLIVDNAGLSFSPLQPLSSVIGTSGSVAWLTQPTHTMFEFDEVHLKGKGALAITPVNVTGFPTVSKLFLVLFFFFFENLLSFYFRPMRKSLSKKIK